MVRGRRGQTNCRNRRGPQLKLSGGSASPRTMQCARRSPARNASHSDAGGRSTRKGDPSFSTSYKTRHWQSRRRRGTCCRFDHTFDERASIRSRRVVHRGSGRRLAQWEGDYSWLASTVACVTQSPTGRSLGALRRPRDDTPSFRDVLKDANHVPSLEAKQKAAFSKTPGRFRNRPSLKVPAGRAATTIQYIRT